MAQTKNAAGAFMRTGGLSVQDQVNCDRPLIRVVMHMLAVHIHISALMSFMMFIVSIMITFMLMIPVMIMVVFAWMIIVRIDIAICRIQPILMHVRTLVMITASAQTCEPRAARYRHGGNQEPSL